MFGAKPVTAGRTGCAPLTWPALSTALIDPKAFVVPYSNV